MSSWPHSASTPASTSGTWHRFEPAWHATGATSTTALNTTAASDFKFDDGVLRASIVLDTLDDANFPASGNFLNVEYIWALEGLGSDQEYQRLSASGGHALTHNDNTLLLVTDYAGAIGSTLPLYRSVSEGGFFNLSGFDRGELRGQYSLVFKGIFYRKISGERFETFGMPVYLGGSVEYGNVTGDRNDLLDDMIIAGSLFLGVDSPLGPVYFGYGKAEGGQRFAVPLHRPDLLRQLRRSLARCGPSSELAGAQPRHQRGHVQHEEEREQVLLGLAHPHLAVEHVETKSIEYARRQRDDRRHQAGRQTHHGGPDPGARPRHRSAVLGPTAAR